MKMVKVNLDKSRYAIGKDENVALLTYDIRKVDDTKESETKTEAMRTAVNKILDDLGAISLVGVHLLSTFWYIRPRRGYGVDELVQAFNDMNAHKEFKGHAEILFFVTDAIKFLSYHNNLNIVKQLEIQIAKGMA